MDITVQINGNTKHGREATPQWIIESITAAQRAGPVCVRVTLKDPLVNVTLGTPGCSGGGGRAVLNATEQRFLDLWIKHRLTVLDFAPGEVVAFLREVGHHN